MAGRTRVGAACPSQVFVLPSPMLARSTSNTVETFTSNIVEKGSPHENDNLGNYFARFLGTQEANAVKRSARLTRHASAVVVLDCWRYCRPFPCVPAKIPLSLLPLVGRDFLRFARIGKSEEVD
jgi:hypothetical protein